MAFDFPASPTVGQVFQPVAGTIYTWNGYAWALATPATQLPGARVLIQSQTVGAAVANVDFKTGIDATYDEYMLVFYNVKPDTVGQNLTILVSNDGTTFKTDATYQYSGWYTGSIGTPTWIQTSTGTSIPLALANVTAVGNGTMNGTARFWKPNINQFCNFMIDGISHTSGTSFSRYSASGAYAGSSLAISAFRLVMTSGNIAQGTFNLYGIKK